MLQTEQAGHTVSAEQQRQVVAVQRRKQCYCGSTEGAAHHQEVQYVLVCCWQHLRCEHHQGLHWLPAQRQQRQQAVIWVGLFQGAHIQGAQTCTVTFELQCKWYKSIGTLFCAALCSCLTDGHDCTSTQAVPTPDGAMKWLDTPRRNAGPSVSSATSAAPASR